MKSNVIITGVTGGFGQCLKRVLEEDFNVIGTSTIKEKCDNARIFHLDFRNYESIQIFTSHLVGREIDAIILNSGVAILGNSWEITEDEIREMFEVNFFGNLALLNSFSTIPQKLVYISSACVIHERNGLLPYSTTKFVMEKFISDLPEGVEKLIVRPGPMKTDMKIKISRNAKLPMWRPIESDFENPLDYASEVLKFLL